MKQLAKPFHRGTIISSIILSAVNPIISLYTFAIIFFILFTEYLDEQVVHQDMKSYRLFRGILPPETSLSFF